MILKLLFRNLFFNIPSNFNQKHFFMKEHGLIILHTNIQKVPFKDHLLPSAFLNNNYAVSLIFGLKKGFNKTSSLLSAHCKDVCFWATSLAYIYNHLWILILNRWILSRNIIKQELSFLYCIFLLKSECLWKYKPLSNMVCLASFP